MFNEIYTYRQIVTKTYIPYNTKNCPITDIYCVENTF